MKLFAAPILLILLVLLIKPFSIHAQEENATTISEGNRYISFKIKAIDKYDSRIERQQKILLNKLKKKEKRFEHKLKSSDSTAYARYKKLSSPSFSSIGKLSKSENDSIDAKFAKQKNPTIDSLKGVQSFVQSKSAPSDTVNKIAKSDTSNTSQPDTSSTSTNLSKSALTDSLKRVQSLVQSKSAVSTSVPQTQGSTAELNNLQGEMNFRNYVTQLITQRMNSLKSLAGSESNVSGLTGIEKQVFYAKSRMKEFKDMEEDPTKAEDKTMEYLQGTPGFDKYMSNATGDNATTSGIQNTGLQTKQMFQSDLNKKFGGNAGFFAGQAGAGLKQWQNDINDITNNIKDAKQSINGVTHTGAPSFKVNPMRGLPFWKRLQKQFNWQATRATSTQPAIVEPSAMIGFKQTPKLTYGLGIAAAFGLGQSWQNIHCTYQGVGARSFAEWKLVYGIGAYAGYERLYRQFTFSGQQNPAIENTQSDVHNNSNYTESVLIGFTKTYKLNNKYNGQMQLLYDIWWQQKGLQSPFVLRFSTVKN